MFQTPADIINAKGGPAEFAKALRKAPGVVRTWKNRGQFPRSSWPDILDAFPDLTLDRLKEVEAAGK